MKLFNLSAVALLSTLPLSTAVDKGDQKWEVKLNSAEEHLGQMVHSFATQYHNYAQDTSINNDFTDALGPYLVDMVTYYDTNFRTEQDPVQAIITDYTHQFTSSRGIIEDDLTVIHAGTSLNRDDYWIASGDENQALTIQYPLSEISSLSVQTTLVKNVEGYVITNEWGDDEVNLYGTAEDNLEAVNPADYLSNYIEDNTSASSVNNIYPDDKLFNLSRDFWEMSSMTVRYYDDIDDVGKDDVSDHLNVDWSTYTYDELGIVPVKGSPILGWIIFLIPTAALFGPLVAKKVNDHKMKTLVKKDGA